jgi:type I restriction enzyme R subunit
VRIDEIAADLVRHFSARGYLGKAMFVAIDKATAVRMHDKVRKAWTAELAVREEQFAKASKEARAGLAERLDWMRSVDMAVVVSQSQNEIDDLKQKGLDILPHRERMQKEDLESKFKNSDDPLRLVFVCAMWITGFDVPTCSTVYLDKPMKNHTLMQTIARATRLDRLARSVADFVRISDTLDRKKVSLRVLAMGLDTGNASGRLMLNVLSSVAQLEREVMLERQREGIAKAKAAGKYRGRKPTARAKADDVIARFKAGERVADIARAAGIGRASCYRVLTEAGLMIPATVVRTANGSVSGSNTIGGT